MLQLLASLANVASARFASFVYTSIGSGETAKYNVILGVDYERVYQDDIETLNALIPTLSGVELVAAQEVLVSLKKSLKSWRDGQSNPDSTSAHMFTSVPDVKGLKVHNETGNLYLLCSVLHKETIVPGTFKKVNSSAKTIAKRKIESTLKKGRIRTFVLPNIAVASMDKQVLILSPIPTP